MATRNYLVFDMGASNGRAVVVRITDRGYLYSGLCIGPRVLLVLVPFPGCGVVDQSKGGNQQHNYQNEQTGPKVSEE